MNRSQCELDDIALYVGIVRSGGVSAATTRLGVPRSTLSRALQRLEQRLEVKLARRTPRAFALTDAGRVFYERVYAAVDALRAAPEGLGADSAGATLRITVPVLLAHFLLPAALELFRARFPRVELRVLVDDGRRDIEAEGLDLAVRVGDPGGVARIGRTLFSSVRRLYAAPGYVARHGAPEHPDALPGHVLIACVPLPRIDEALVWRLRQGDVPRDLPVTPALAMNDPEAALALAEAGQGVALLPDFVAAEALSRGGLVRILPDVQTASHPIRALLTDGRQASDSVRALVEALAAAASALAERSRRAEAAAAKAEGLRQAAGN